MFDEIIFSPAALASIGGRTCAAIASFIDHGRPTDEFAASLAVEMILLITAAETSIRITSKASVLSDAEEQWFVRLAGICDDSSGPADSWRRKMITRKKALDRCTITRPSISLLASGIWAIDVIRRIPRLSPDSVTFPGRRRSYADISIPASMGGFVLRLAEIEETLLALTFDGPGYLCPEDAGIRRTYAYFEALRAPVPDYLTT